MKTKKIALKKAFSNLWFCSNEEPKNEETTFSLDKREDGCAFSLFPSVCTVGRRVRAGTPSFSEVLVLGCVRWVLLLPALQAYVLDLLRNVLHESMNTGMLSGEECKS